MARGCALARGGGERARCARGAALATSPPPRCCCPPLCHSLTARRPRRRRRLRRRRPHRRRRRARCGGEASRRCLASRCSTLASLARKPRCGARGGGRGGGHTSRALRLALAERRARGETCSSRHVLGSHPRLAHDSQPLPLDRRFRGAAGQDGRRRGAARHARRKGAVGGGARGAPPFRLARPSRDLPEIGTSLRLARGGGGIDTSTTRPCPAGARAGQRPAAPLLPSHGDSRRTALRQVRERAAPRPPPRASPSLWGLGAQPVASVRRRGAARVYVGRGARRRRRDGAARVRAGAGQGERDGPRCTRDAPRGTE